MDSLWIREELEGAFGDRIIFADPLEPGLNSLSRAQRS